MASYTIRYTDAAKAKKDDLLAGPHRSSLLSALNTLRDDPASGVDQGDNSWKVTFSGGTVHYVISKRYITVTVIDFD